VIPVFVRAGSIVPLGAPVLSTDERQAIREVRVYPGANGEFTLYNDDGKSYAYEQGKREITHLRWNDASGKLTHTGAAAWYAPDGQIVKVVR
jgi:alpha-glucosidase (family GH31 glycosyl hydrolase)